MAAAPTQQAVTRPPVTEEDLVGYDTVVAVVSKIFAQAMKDTLAALQDRDNFQAEITRLAESQGLPQSLVSDPEALYTGFWKCANGLRTEFEWLNSLNRPYLWDATVQTFEPSDPKGISPTVEIGFGGLGFNLGIKW